MLLPGCGKTGMTGGGGCGTGYEGVEGAAALGGGVVSLQTAAPYFTTESSGSTSVASLALKLQRGLGVKVVITEPFFDSAPTERTPAQ